MNLDCLFNPKSIALIGAAHTEEKLGGIILKNLLRFRGMVYPVNPNYNELMGLKAFRSVQEISGFVDLCIIIRPANEVNAIFKELKGKTGCVIVVSSGFSEIGNTGPQDELKRLGREANIRILGPNCMGLFNPHKSLDTFFLPHERLRRPGKGNTAIVSQSGAILSCLLGAMQSSNIGVSKAVTYGNAIDIDESDLYEYLADDAQTDVVISYIESVGDGRRFIEKAKKLSGKKSLIILKSGKSQSGQSAAFSHTGRLAGRYEVFSSIIRQSEISEVSDLDELIDSAKALSYQKPFKGNRVLIITNGGGSGVLAADECMRQGLEVAELPDDKREKLKKIFPYFYGIHNPLDLTGQVKDEDYITALDELTDAYDGFMVIALPNVIGITERFPALMKHFRMRTDKPVVSYMAQSGITKKLTVLLERSKIPVFSSPERAVRALRTLLL